MQVLRANLDSCADAVGTVVIIDVLRAFTTACYAFEAGVIEIVFAGSVDQALALKRVFPRSLISGEIDGFPVAGFDLPNSPSALHRWNLSGARLIQQTTAGSQGVLRSRRASTLLAASLCNLTATVHYLQAARPPSVTLVPTGLQPGGWGDEDAACADAIELLLDNRPLDLSSIKNRVAHSRSGLHYNEIDNPVFPISDLECALQIDRYPHPLLVSRRTRHLVMKPLAE